MPTALTDRYQFNEYVDRAAYKTSTGKEAPIWRVDRPAKKWQDLSAASKPSTNYKVWNQDPVKPALLDMTISGADAAAVNMPGVPDFPKYVPGPTAATQSLHFGSYVGPGAPVDVTLLSTKKEADDLAALCGAQVVELSAVSPFYTYTWNGETRRPYKLIYKNIPQPVDVTVAGVYVGQLLATINSRGVGAPYHFSAAQLALGVLEVVFEVVPDGSGDHPTMPMPILLKPGEELQSVMINTGVYTVVVGQTGTAPPSGTGSGGGFTDADRKKLDAIYKAVAGA